MTELGEITSCYTMTWVRKSRHAPARLWHCITDADQITRWMSYPARIDLRVGGEFFVDFSRTAPPGHHLEGVIVKVEPEQRFTYVWGLSVIEWRIEPDPAGDGCTYTFVHHGQPPPEDPEREDIAAGWHLWLDDFDAHLDGNAPSTVAGEERWREINPRYQKMREAALGMG